MTTGGPPTKRMKVHRTHRDIDMLVLDALQDDVEQIPSIMRMLGEGRHGLDEEYTSDDVVDALVRLLRGGLVAALQESVHEPELVRVGAPNFARSALRQYWYEPTPSGQAAWEMWDKESNPTQTGSE
jgi:hypothetical protein